MGRAMTSVLAVAVLALIAAGAWYAIRPHDGPCTSPAVVTRIESHMGAIGIDADGNMGHAPSTYSVDFRTPDEQSWTTQLDRSGRPAVEVGDHVTAHCVREGAGFWSDGEMRHCGLPLERGMPDD